MYVCLCVVHSTKDGTTVGRRVFVSFDTSMNTKCMCVSIRACLRCFKGDTARSIYLSGLNPALHFERPPQGPPRLEEDITAVLTVYLITRDENLGLLGGGGRLSFDLKLKSTPQILELSS